MSNSKKPPSIQGIAWEPGLQAIKDSVAFSSFDEFRSHLQNNARQNSEETRKKYASLIITRLFPERSLDGINPTTWRSYQDEILLRELARVTTLEAETVISKFLLEQVLILPVGTEIDNSILRDFISTQYGCFKRDSYQRLGLALKHMGFLTYQDNRMIVQPMPIADNALLVILHARLARTPRIVRVSDIISARFWKLLGIRKEETVRNILHEAETKELIAKYIIVDQLEQITTRYSYNEYLAKALRL